mgnify:CR=1 FL=1
MVQRQKRFIVRVFDATFVALFLVLLLTATAIASYHLGFRHGLDGKVTIIGEKYILKVKGR